MGKFEIGQYVRRTKGSSLHTAAGIHEAGFVGQVSAVEISTCGAELLFTNGQRGIADKYEPWVPKIGERVRVTKSIYDNEKLQPGATGDITVHYHTTMYGVKIDDFDGDSWAFPTDRLEPVITPITITIEAGKFYKTRDGRKVGPVSHNGHGVYGAPGFGANRWYATGRSYSDAKTLPTDIIAEWVDEPKASNDHGGVASLIGKSVTVQVAKPKFKVGDRVLSTEVGPTRGLTGTVIVDDGSRVPYRVRFDNWNEGNGANDNEWWLLANEVAPAPVATNPAIVCLIENGQPKPSSTPHIHADEAKAGKEAARLAGVYKGKEFGVFVLTTTARQAAPAYKHEWQRQAAAGNKISAIKELRAANDLTLKGAKDAVEHWLETAA